MEFIFSRARAMSATEGITGYGGEDSQTTSGATGSWTGLGIPSSVPAARRNSSRLVMSTLMDIVAIADGSTPYTLE